MCVQVLVIEQIIEFWKLSVISGRKMLYYQRYLHIRGGTHWRIKNCSVFYLKCFFLEHIEEIKKKFCILAVEAFNCTQWFRVGIGWIFIVGRKSPLNVLKLLEGLVGSERKSYK